MASTVVHTLPPTAHGPVTITATVEHDGENTFIRVIGEHGTESHEYRATVGASDGNDSLAGADADQVATIMQNTLDAARAQVVTILMSRAAVHAAAKSLK